MSVWMMAAKFLRMAMNMALPCVFLIATAKHYQEWEATYAGLRGRLHGFRCFDVRGCLSFF